MDEMGWKKANERRRKEREEKSVCELREREGARKKDEMTSVGGFTGDGIEEPTSTGQNS